ncbi:MAG: hypothetical protein NVSMB9_31450 [Isosphaeraceae bacterium]
MKWFRPHRRCLIALGFLTLLPIGWSGLLVIIPTGWACQKISRRLSEASGRVVTLGRVRIGLLGGVYVQDLKIGAPRSGDDPWLQVGEASIHVNLFQLAFGPIEPTEVEARNVRLRVLRYRDGRLELADLLRKGAEPRNPRDLADETSEPSGWTVKVYEATVLVQDEPTGTRLELSEVEGRGTCQGRLIHVSEIRGLLHGGSFQMAAQLDGSEEVPRCEGQIRLRNVALRPGMDALQYLAPVIAGASGSLDGKLSLDLSLRGQGETRAAIGPSLRGHGRVSLDPIVLDGSSFLNEVGSLLDRTPRGRVGAVSSDFTVQKERVTTNNLTLNVGKVPMILAGWTGFDGRVSYRLRVDHLADRLPARASELLKEVAIHPEELADLKVEGTVDHLVVSVDGVSLVPLREGEPAHGPDRPRLQEIGRRIRERVRR